MLTLDSDIWNALHPLIDAGVLVWLAAIEMTDGEAFYLTRNNADVSFSGKTWHAANFNISSVDDAGEGDLPETVLAMSNVDRVAMQYLESGSWDQGRASIFLVLLGAPVKQVLRFDMTMQSATATHEIVNVRLGRPNLFEKPFPNTRYTRRKYPGIQTNP